MVATLTPASIGQLDSNSLDVRFRGELIPDRPTRSEAVSRRIPEVACEPSIAALSTRLADSIWPRLPLAAQVFSKSSDRTAIVKAYVDSLNELQEYQNGLAHLVSVTCKANLEFRQERGTTNQAHRTKSLGDTLDNMIARANLPSKPISNDLTATVAAQPVEQLHRTLTSALKRAVTELASNVEAALQNMARQRLAGLVEWVGENACRYHFFKEVVIQENDGFKSSSKRGTRTATDENGNRRQQAVQRTTSGESGQTFHRWARHEHHVMNAVHTSIANSRVMIPLSAQRVVEALPAWLRPFVRIIDGDLIRERVIECDYQKEKWSDVTTREVDLPNPPVDRPTFAADPAITIDSFILTGWGPREIAAEVTRRQLLDSADREKKEVAAARRERMVWITGAVAAVAVSSLLIQSTHSPALCVLALALSVYAALNAVRLQARSMGLHAAPEHYCIVALFSIAISLGGGCISLGLGFHSFRDVGLGIVMIALGIAGLAAIPCVLRRPLFAKPKTTGVPT